MEPYIHKHGAVLASVASRRRDAAVYFQPVFGYRPDDIEIVLAAAGINISVDDALLFGAPVASFPRLGWSRSVFDEP